MRKVHLCQVAAAYCRYVAVWLILSLIHVCLPSINYCMRTIIVSLSGEDQTFMNSEFQTLNTLFAQLGLPNDDNSINRFINEHRLGKYIRIDQATFWSPTKALFIREAFEQDSEWSGIVDQLDSQLRN